MVGASWAAHGLGPDAPDEGAIELDLAIQALKDEVIEFHRDAMLAEETHLYPSETRATVYVSTSLPHLLLEQISLTVDDSAPVVYRYQDRDARALLAPDALQRLARLNVERGRHRLQVSFAGNLVEADEDPVPVSGSFDTTFEKGLDPAEIELVIRRGGSRDEVAMTMRQWKLAP